MSKQKNNKLNTLLASVITVGFLLYIFSIPIVPVKVSPASQPAPSPVSVSSTSNIQASPVSYNWSGYVSSGGTYSAVGASWIIPQVTGGAFEGDATWIGIGGVNHNDLIQTGTQAIIDLQGNVNYQAWIELLPGNSEQIPLTVSPGDSITASISLQKAKTWQLSIKDNTTGQSYQTTKTYSSSMSSADWIQEMLSYDNGLNSNSFVPIDNFNSIRFTNAWTVKDGTLDNIAESNAQPVTMINSAEEPLATPSSLTNGTDFTITRTTAQPISALEFGLFNSSFGFHRHH